MISFKIENISESSNELEEGVSTNDTHEEEKEVGEMSDSNAGMEMFMEIIIYKTF